MKIKNQFEDLLVESNRSIDVLQRKIGNEKIGSAKKQYAPLFQLMDEIVKYHKKNDRQLLKIIEKLNEIEKVLKELKYE